MPFTGDPPFSAAEATPAHQWAQRIAAGLVPRTVRRYPGRHGFRVETVHPEFGELYRGEIGFVRIPVTLPGAYMAWELSDPDWAPATDLVLACDYLTAETILLDRTSAWDAPATPQDLADMARDNDDEPVLEPDTHVYTAAELRNPTTRPRARYDAIRVLAPFTAPRGPDDTTEGRYRVPSPCCGRIILVPHAEVARLLSGDDGWLVCGKPYGQPRRRGTGCAAWYRIRPLAATPRPSIFTLTRTGV